MGGCKALSCKSAGGANNASGPVVWSAQLLNEALRNWQAFGVVTSQKIEKNAASPLPMRTPPVQRYREIRGHCLMGPLHAGDAPKRDIDELARLLRVLSGRYDQAMRAAALRWLNFG